MKMSNNNKMGYMDGYDDAIKVVMRMEDKNA